MKKPVPKHLLMTYSAINLTEALVRCPSVTPEDAGAQQVVVDALKPLGFSFEHLRFEGNGGSYGVDNLFARLGDKGPHLCFGGHTDVVPTGDDSAWTYPPFTPTIQDGRMYGRGTADMKAGNAAFICAVAQYIEEFGSPEGSISLLITGDEEKEGINGSKQVLKWIQENGHTPDVALIGEPSCVDVLGDEIKVGRRGSLTAVITVNGKQGHTAYPALADNPLPRLVKLLDALNNYTFDEGSDFFPPTNCEVVTIDVGNPSHNVIPAKGSAKFNIRFSDHWTGESLSQKIREIFDSTGADYDIDITVGAESFLTTSEEWISLVSAAVKEETGVEPEASTKGGTSDARFFQAYCPVVEFGLSNKTIHQIDEYLVLEDLEKLVAVYKNILMRFFQK